MALIDFVRASREWQMMYTPWGVCPREAQFPEAYRPARGAVLNLSQFADAGAVAVILIWASLLRKDSSRLRVSISRLSEPDNQDCCTIAFALKPKRI